MYKFKSLTDDETAPLKDRQFAFGNFIRNTSLDELPQLFNVMKGEMSLVGPRALPSKYLDYIPPIYKKRFDMRPGITGLAQVNGRNRIDWYSKFKLDVEYVDRVSFCTDLNILLKTVFLVLFKKNKDSLGEISLIDYVQKSEEK